MSKSTSNKGSNVGFFGLLFITFLVLKLVGVISWSWWLVTLPLWGPLILVLPVFAIFFLIYRWLDKK